MLTHTYLSLATLRQIERTHTTHDLPAARYGAFLRAIHDHTETGANVAEAARRVIEDFSLTAKEPA